MSDNSSYDVSVVVFIQVCFRSEVSVLVFSAISVTNLFLLLPVFLLVLYLGYQQWRSGSTAATSHSNLFTYHAIAMQLNEFLGLFLLFFGGYNGLENMIGVGLSLMPFTSNGQALFHILTCVEHYLAVVHPVTYLQLKRAGEVRIRNLCTGCVWLLSFGWMVVCIVGGQDLSFIMYFCVVLLSLLVVSSCCTLVLCALKRPGPGNKERVDKSKQKAFNTILTIMAVVVFEFMGNLSLTVIKYCTILSPTVSCVVYMSSVWVDMPGSLVLPLLFLHRARKLQCCKQSSESR